MFIYPYSYSTHITCKFLTLHNSRRSALNLATFIQTARIASPANLDLYLCYIVYSNSHVWQMQCGWRYARTPVRLEVIGRCTFLDKHGFPILVEHC